MRSGWLGATLLGATALLVCCHESAAPTAVPAYAATPASTSALTQSASPAMSTPAPPSSSSSSSSPASASAPVSFDEDLAFLSKYGAVKVLTSANGGRIVVSGQYQARVMTSAVGPGGRSLGFINRKFIEAGKTATAFDNYGGEDRFWLGPEGGQYGLYFSADKPFTFDNWQTPHAMQEGIWQARSETPTSVSYRHAFSVTNYSKREFKVEIQRDIALLSADQARARLGIPLPPTLSFVAYATSNKLTNTGRDAWNERSGLLSIWILGMFAPVPGTQVIIPFEKSAKGEVVNDRYFGKVLPERLQIREQEGYLLFRADGQSRGKIGLGPARAKSALGSYSDSAKLLTLVLYDKPQAATHYVNSMWERQANPYAGDVVNSYNDGPPGPGIPPLGGFYEIESSSPAAALAPNESITHVHQTYHFTGPKADLDALCHHVLGVSLSELPAE